MGKLTAVSLHLRRLEVQQKGIYGKNAAHLLLEEISHGSY